MSDPNELSLTAITPAATAIGAETVEYWETCESTNTRGLEIALSGQPLPALVVAKEQTAGRGRSGNRWWSASGSLTFSVVWPLAESSFGRPTPAWSLLAGLAVHQSFCWLHPQGDYWLKWPNDIYAAVPHQSNVCKLAGILVEMASQRQPAVVIGIGVNINNSLHDAPLDVQQRATSLTDIADTYFELADVLENICSHLHGQLMSKPNRPTLAAQWQHRCLLTGKTVQISQGDSQLQGRCLGIDNSGALLLETDAGTKIINSGVVENWQ